MAARYSATNIEAARQFLYSLPDVTFKKPLTDPKYVTRLANQFSRQIGAGLPINRQIARRGPTTKEHPERAAPQRSVQEVRAYKTARVTGVTPSVPKGIKVYPNGTRQYVGGRTFAREAVRDAAALDRRVEVRVFNKKTGTWQHAYENRGHTRGISAKALQDRAAANGVSVAEQIVADAEGYEEVDAGDLEDLAEEMAELFSEIERGDYEPPTIDLGDYSLWEVDIL